MVFSSELFIFGFLPCFLASYYLVPKKWKNLQILLGSLFFYAWGAPKFILIVLLSSWFDYLLSLRILKVGKVPGKRLVAFSVLINIAVLFYMKYANFFVGEVNRIFEHFGMDTVTWTHVVLPIGISFITFQKISYMADIYKGTVSPPKSLLNFLVYVFYFPQLIAGPIVRYHDINKEIETRRHSYQDFYNGFFRFCIGLAKKILLADCLGEVADTIFALPPGSMTVLFAWIGILCYTFQIYYDFSAYSDMAIGMARMMGFHLLENFNWPYISTNITEFWRRWHISLSRWMKEYLYLPLGGNRVGRVRGYTNLWIVFLFSGLWHGANWTFIAWGAFHGLFLTIDKLRSHHKGFGQIPKGLRITTTFFIIMMGWVLFRSDTIQGAWQYYGYLFGNAPLYKSPQMWVDVLSNRSVFIIFTCLLSFLAASRTLSNWITGLHNKIPAGPLWTVKIATGFCLFVLSVSTLCNSSFHPFLYFRF